VAGKLLLGSDAPNTGVRVGDQLAAVRSWPLPAGTLEKVAGGTARRLVSALRAQ
jgi:hypothetical protein